MSLMSLTAVELGKKIKAGEVTVKEAVEAAFAQIEKVEGDVHSFVTLTKEQALKDAGEIQKKIDAGELTGPLAGVPVALKDNLCTKGVLTTCSSKILYNFVPTYTAQAVENLQKAGAVIIGKTNMDEFAMGSTTETSAYGVTKNPWNLEHVPGGSSGGSCAGGSRRVQLCVRFRYRWFHPPAKFILRSDWLKTNLWNGIPLRTDRLWFFLRSDRTGGKRRDRLCHHFRSNYFL